RSKSRLLRYTTSTAIHHLYAFTLIGCNKLFVYTVVASIKNSQAFEQQQFSCRFSGLPIYRCLMAPSPPVERPGDWVHA
ncbi:MAG: hypothetical protein KJ794_15710, partial [Gammaproteobacteria bacterium]|nr:hypothetical protein [Gammaproteobacteria bacterium]